MTVETATYITDLQPANPPATDPRSQGDDHIRLIKQVLQNSFGSTTRQFQIPGVLSKSSNYSVAKADGESAVYVSTASGAITLTLPSLVAADAGWKIYFVKTSSDANPMFIAPPTGTINSGGIAGLSKARRAIPGISATAIWDGSAWFVTRALAIPIGSCIEYHGTALPPGYEWPNGQTLSSAANYPEYNSAMGGLTTRDKRGYASVCLDNLGGAAAGRLPGGVINGSVIGSVGGADVVALSIAQLPAHQHTGTTNAADRSLDHTHNYGTPLQVGLGTSGGGLAYSSSTTATTAGANTSLDHLHTFTTAVTGSGAAHSNLQPSMMVSQILVVE